jgi:hypothetical protein
MVDLTGRIEAKKIEDFTEGKLENNTLWSNVAGKSTNVSPWVGFLLGKKNRSFRVEFRPRYWKKPCAMVSGIIQVATLWWTNIAMENHHS